MPLPGLLSTDPAAMGNMGLAIGLLQGGAPSRVPNYFGASLAQGLSIGSQMQLEAQQANARRAFIEAETQNRALQAEMQRYQLESTKKSQASIDELARMLPPQDQAVFQANPTEYVKNLIARNNPKYNVVGGNLVQTDPTGSRAVFTADQDQWGQPFLLGGQVVQQNKMTGQIRQAVTQPTQVTQQNFPPPTAAIDPRTGQPAFFQFGNRGEIRETGLRPLPTAEERKAQEDARKAAERGQEATETANLVIKKVDEAVKDIGPLTTGAIGAITGMIPGTTSYDLDKTIDTIKANVGFKELQEMRANSPTGGALGQIAVRELDFLQAAIASLDKKQSPEKLRANLQEIRSSFERWKATVRQTGGLAPETQGQQVPAGGGWRIVK